MSQPSTALSAAQIFDGEVLHRDHAVLLRDGTIVDVVPRADLPGGIPLTDLGAGILAPGFVDLQVNGGDGIMLNDAPTLAGLRRIVQAHARLGATSILPTLISDTPAQTRTTIDAVVQAIAADVPGIAGLHLEGPHFALSRKGAHDPALIRAMTEDDLALLLDAAKRLPLLKLTFAPEAVTIAQIRALSAAGVLLSIGHSDATFAQCGAAIEAGVTCVTHLFNAQSQLASREPGVVGAALAHGGVSAGLIADGIHVHPATMKTALQAKTGPGRMFLVSDAMAPAGSDIDHFDLNGRLIERRNGRLTLEDGTLAGADLDMATAVRVLVADVGLPLVEALQMATSVPAGIARLGGGAGRITAGGVADMVHLDADGALAAVWQRGRLLG
ncbi:MAG: N-acetylglucosamine-6-phosphate deacetylase [Rhodobacteraceae bacterium]|nr:N-acetylglucosamine-6-phosphate deacetylase [Paracoccaceae bacterium]